MFLTPLPPTFFGKVQFFLVFGLATVLGILVWPVVALYDLLLPEKLEKNMDWKEHDSFDDEEEEDTDPEEEE